MSVSELKAAQARADAKIAEGMELYFERNKMAFFYYRLKIQDLKRLNRLVATLTDQELQMVARYAEGLALWREPESNSPDAPVPQGQATAATAASPVTRPPG